LVKIASAKENGNQFTDFSANENGFGCIQNQSLDKCKQIRQFIAHENGFGFVKKPTMRENANQLTNMSKTILEKCYPIR
jgi:hypothetical protein